MASHNAHVQAKYAEEALQIREAQAAEHRANQAASVGAVLAVASLVSGGPVCHSYPSVLGGVAPFVGARMLDQEPMPNLASDIWRDGNCSVVIVVENKVPPTDAEWAGYIANIEKSVTYGNTQGLAVTDGGSPNAAQRARVNALVTKAATDRKVFSAVVSGSLAIRGVVGALRLFNKETNAFSPSQTCDALRFIQVPEALWPSLWRVVMDLDAKISPRSVDVERASRNIALHAAGA